MTKLLEIKNLHLAYQEKGVEYPILNGISLDVLEGEMLGLVGESGCGKSMTAMSIMRLFDKTQIKIQKGEILFKGKNLLNLSEKSMRKIRTKEIAIIFQDPMTSLNPVYNVGKQIIEAIKEHKKISQKEALQEAIHYIETVGIPDPEKSAMKYPHELSGGMRQRIMIAIALCCTPKLLIADEPTTALDVTVQHQIISLILELKEKFRMSVILITHDLGLIAETVSRLGVMYAGDLIEFAPTKKIFQNPLHPYTQGLIDCIPKIGSKKKKLQTIAGNVPPLKEREWGCSFVSRCPYKMDICSQQKPLLEKKHSKHWSACWLKIKK